MGRIGNLATSLKNPYLKGEDKPVGRQTEYYARESLAFIQAYGRYANNNYNMPIAPWGRDETKIFKCRVEDAFDEQANTKRGDDWKELLFYDEEPEITIGIKAYFAGSVWLGFNTRNVAALTSSVVVRRCDNVINFVDEFGNVTPEPFVLDKYTVLNSTDIVSRSDPTSLINGHKQAWAQYNERTATLRTNDRIILQGQAWVIRGIDSISRQGTSDRDSVKVISFTIQRTEERDVDDLENDIANAKANVWTIGLDASDVTLGVGSTVSCGAQLFHNGEEVTDYAILYESSNESVATVDKDGNVTILSEGDAVITCKFEKNMGVYAELNVSGVETVDHEYSIVFNPEVRQIRQYESATITAALYDGASLSSSDVTFTVDGVSKSLYETAVFGNSVTITALAPYARGKLSVTASADVDGETITKTIEITLQAAF